MNIRTRVDKTKVGDPARSVTLEVQHVRQNPSRPGKSYKLSSSGKFRILQCPQNSMIRVKGQRETCASNFGVA